MSSQINTEQSKRAAILEGVTLQSCNGDVNEQKLKVERLMAIIDDSVLQFALNEYVLPYRDYKEGRKIMNRDTLIDSNEFIHKVGYQSNFMFFILHGFRIPSPEDDLKILEENKQRYLSNGNEKGLEVGRN